MEPRDTTCSPHQSHLVYFIANFLAFPEAFQKAQRERRISRFCEVLNPTQQTVISVLHTSNKAQEPPPHQQSYVPAKPWGKKRHWIRNKSSLTCSGLKYITSETAVYRSTKGKDLPAITALIFRQPFGPKILRTQTFPLSINQFLIIQVNQ